MLLFIFFLLSKSLAVAPSPYLIAAACIGSFFNPFAFFVRAVRPHYLKSLPRTFLVRVTVSCILTTIGYASFAYLVTKYVIE